MATKTINTRILLKYDTYANWTTNNPVLKAGEVAIATIASGNTQEVNSVTAPQVLIKVGDGTSTYSALPFVSAKAADVYGWAKAANKPTYNANEIEGLSDYISGEIQDTDTQYQIVKVDDYNYKLQSKSLNGSWADVSGGAIVIPKYDDTEVKADISALETLVGTTAVATQIANAISALDLANTYEAKGTAATEAGKVQSALNTYKNSNDAVIAAIKDGTTIDSFADVESAIQGINDNNDLISAELSNKADKSTTLAGYGITDAYTKGEGTALASRVSDNEDAIGVLNGTGEGSVSKTVDDAINEFAAKVSDDGTVNTYKELIDYAAEHGSEFTELVGEVSANTNAIATLNGAGAGSVDKKIADAIAAENLSQYATDGDVSGLRAEMETELNAVYATFNKKANTADLAAIATTGNVNDLVQTTGDVLIFNCGDSTNCGA